MIHRVAVMLFSLVYLVTFAVGLTTVANLLSGGDMEARAMSAALYAVIGWALLNLYWVLSDWRRQ